MEKIQTNDHSIAFDSAIKSGRLSEDPKSDIYAGDYMYMGTNQDGIDLFKHIDTRKYLEWYPNVWASFEIDVFEDDDIWEYKPSAYR
jgi:hypothetical protein